MKEGGFWGVQAWVAILIQNAISLIRSVSQIAAACSGLIPASWYEVLSVWVYYMESVSKNSVVLLSIYWTSRGRKVWFEANAESKTD